MATYHIDQIDQKILSFLVNNARMPFLEIARECGVSGAAIHQRVKRLETNGVITGSRLLVKPQALGLNVCAFISVTLSEADKYPEVVANLKKIAESGQCFRWKELGPGKYLIPSGQTCAIMEQKEPDDDLHLLIEEGTLPLWQDYLNYGERYGSIIREAREATLADGSPDLFLREAVLEAAGVQILTQDLWETLVSFVISQNNNIPRIKKLVAALCKQFGDRRQLAGHEFYTFPTWERLAGQDLSGLGLGYRDKYVEQLAQNVTDGRIDLHELTGMETEQARTYLKSIHGVGNKVADCVLLFGLHRVEAFPVDTWIRQVIDEHYGGKFPVEHYDGHAGIIQQFIFYYMQQHKGGKTT